MEQLKLRNPIRFKSSVSTAVKVAFELRKLWQLANLMNNCECATFNTCMRSTAERGWERRVGSRGQLQLAASTFDRNFEMKILQKGVVDLPALACVKAKNF